MTAGKVTSLADIVYEQVERDILQGVYQEGDVLTEMKLCEKLQVSRTPVREALRRLEQDDLIESRGKSIVVVGIPPEDLMDILEIRERLEGAATARCCQHITRAQLEELDEIITLEEFYVDRNLPEKILEADNRFHSAIYDACGSRIFEKQLEALNKRLQRHRQISISENRRARASVGEHRDIFRALSAGNAELADRLAVLHVQRVKASILSMAGGAS